MSAPLRIRPDSAKKAVGGGEVLKPYLERLLKLIPAEVVSLYLVGIGVIPPKNTIAIAVWAVLCLVAVGVVKAYGTSDRAQGIKPDWTHVILSSIAFVIWVYSTGGPFHLLGWYEAYIGSLLILAFTFIVPYVYRGPAS